MLASGTLLGAFQYCIIFSNSAKNHIFSNKDNILIDLTTCSCTARDIKGTETTQQYLKISDGK